jgi:hypothetical protein
MARCRVEAPLLLADGARRVACFAVALGQPTPAA